MNGANIGEGDDRSQQHVAVALTMANCHVLLDYPLVDVPDEARFVELVS